MKRNNEKRIEIVIASIVLITAIFILNLIIDKLIEHSEKINNIVSTLISSIILGIILIIALKQVFNKQEKQE